MEKLPSFDQLATFISREMKMTHFCYQPVMLRVLLDNSGFAKVEEIATALLVNCDGNSLKKYKYIVNQHPGNTLMKRKIVEPIRDGRKIIGYRLLTDFDSLSKNQIEHLVELCELREDERRPGDIIEFSKERAESQSEGKRTCDFCGIDPRRVMSESDYCFAVRDAFPVTPLHTLVIPKRHVPCYFDLHQPELNAIHRMLDEQRSEIWRKDKTVSSFNLGVNDGEHAGQTIFHAHVHLIPRREGDVAKPRGGVRGVIPEKRDY